jgi:hypothetical protein
VNSDDTMERPGFTRRTFLKGTAGGGVTFYVALSGAGVVASLGGAGGCGELNENQRNTLRSLWDAVVPGTWNGQVEDELSPGVPAPGANDANVQAWIEEVAGSLPFPLDFLTTSFQRTWADDLNLWSDVFHGWPGDDKPKFWALPLGPSLLELGRQHKILLMQALFGTAIDLKYMAGIVLAKVAFYCDFWAEANGSNQRVGRAYIGFPLPPGTTPITDFTYNQVLGTPDTRLVTVGPHGVLALP